MQLSIPKRLLSWIYYLNDFGFSSSARGHGFSAGDIEKARGMAFD